MKSNYKCEAFVLARRYNHIADYRSSIYLSALIDNCHLFIAGDDHTFKQLKLNKKVFYFNSRFFLFGLHNPLDFKL